MAPEEPGLPKPSGETPKEGPKETPKEGAPAGGAAPAKKGSAMTPEEKAAAIEAAKAKAAAAKAAKEAAAAGGAPAPAAAAPAPATGEPAKPAAAAEGAKPAAEAAKPAAAKPAAKEKADPATEIRPGKQVAGGLYLKKGEKPSKEEIIAKALEKIRATEAAIVEKGGPAPEMSRRQLFKKVGWAGFGAYMAFLGGCFGRFFFPRVLFEPPAKFKAGYPQEYTIGEVSTKYKDTNRVWIIRESTGFYAVFARCTHLGCTPMWLEGEQKFKCPCHGSGYTKEAINYEGPAPRPMERCYITIADDGQILVDTGVRYRYEAGQWDNPHAYLRFA